MAARPVTTTLARTPEADTSPWVVHVLGPDDVLPAADERDAVQQAQAINLAALRYVEAHQGERIIAVVWAVPMLRKVFDEESGRRLTPRERTHLALICRAYDDRVGSVIARGLARRLEAAR